ncbi:ATP-binding protein [Nocardiopsis halophila]|uniref:ATP-binding protein n=1 Tax=Nocardiopsis halophila TaxID=141692 RepID=UPI0003482F07|nr:ATP-binding protein [Nocardiopsis halophila]
MSDSNQTTHQRSTSPSPAEEGHNAKRHRLQALAERLTGRGVRCLIALPLQDAPVLYVALRRGTVCVVAAETTGGWTFVGPGLEFDADSLVDDAELCVDEAFCNAKRHTRSGLPGGIVHLALYATADGPLYIDLTDAGPLVPEDRPRVRSGPVGADLDAESGRGMFLIDSLAAHWLYVDKPDGGCLSLTLLTPDRAPAPLPT